jgi:hypothetical protein
MRRALTRCRRKVERTLGIGLDVTRASKEEEGLPETHGFQEPADR